MNPIKKSQGTLKKLQHSEGRHDRYTLNFDWVTINQAESGAK